MYPGTENTTSSVNYVFIKLKTPEITIYKEYVVYTFSGILGSVGGSLGLFIGFSLIEFLLFFVRWAFNMRGQHQNSLGADNIPMGPTQRMGCNSVRPTEAFFSVGLHRKLPEYNRKYRPTPTELRQSFCRPTNTFWAENACLGRQYSV